MPHKANVTLQLDDFTKAAAKQAAADLGLTIGRGTHKDDGSIRQMIYAIATGEAVIGMTPLEAGGETRVLETLEKARQGILENAQYAYQFTAAELIEAMIAMQNDAMKLQRLSDIDEIKNATDYQGE